MEKLVEDHYDELLPKFDKLDADTREEILFLLDTTEDNMKMGSHMVSA